MSSHLALAGKDVVSGFESISGHPGELCHSTREIFGDAWVRLSFVWEQVTIYHSAINVYRVFSQRYTKQPTIRSPAKKDSPLGGDETDTVRVDSRGGHNLTKSVGKDESGVVRLCGPFKNITLLLVAGGVEYS